MGDIASPPNPPTKQRLQRVQSPTGTPFFLASNNDHLERAQSRAARAAAAIRRKSFALLPPPPLDPCLDKQQILDLFHNCIKLASENKINQKNTWDLSLIDHLGEIIKAEEEEDAETNFQKASCTLEAGVKIYSLRVDSVHSEAYKVLGGINRAGLEDDPDGNVEDANTNNGQEELQSKKETEKKISPLSTLEPSFATLNAKKFDVAFAVDPLYHQTSAQFDEGGAKGLLLNNLGVYGRCRVLFDSQEVPGKCMLCENQNDGMDAIDLSFARDSVEQMLINMRIKEEISPTLRTIVSLFDEDNKRQSDIYASQHNADEKADEAMRDCYDEVGFEADNFENCGPGNFDNDGQGSVFDEGPHDVDFANYPEEKETSEFNNSDTDDRFEVDRYLFLNLGFKSKQNAWAGPEHWKYHKAKVPEDHPTDEEVLPVMTKENKKKKKAEPDIDFTKALEEDIPDVFDPPKKAKSLLLPANRAPCNTKLPEDCHYQPENLVKLFLLPNKVCLGKRQKKSSETLRQNGDYEPGSSWDNESAYGDQFDETAYNDVEEPDLLVSQPRQVNKIEVQYDKTSKQVDVQVLKETLWHQLQGPPVPLEEQEKVVSFKGLLAGFPDDCRAAPTIKDISPHLCFICLLHLANEHGLSIQGCASLDDLSIQLPCNNSLSK